MAPRKMRILKTNNFWQSLEAEVIIAKEQNCMIIIELDANAKIGKDNYHKDPNSVSKNGKLLLDMVKRQGLNIANLSSKCSGVITREKMKARLYNDNHYLGFSGLFPRGLEPNYRIEDHPRAILYADYPEQADYESLQVF